MVFKTKMRKNAGSMITVVPAPIVKLLNFESGDELEWEVNISEDTAEIILKKNPDWKNLYFFGIKKSSYIIEWFKNFRQKPSLKLLKLHITLHKSFKYDFKLLEQFI